MNSFNHYAFGSVGQWMYGSIAGIDTGTPGFKKILLRPNPGDGLTHATAMYDSIRGTIESSWKRDGETTTYKFTIPVNTTATVHLHTKDPGGITESGKPARGAEGVKLLWSEGGVAAFQLESGTYEFLVK
jgi:alpha-L-rhamnosidase